LKDLKDQIPAPSELHEAAAPEPGTNTPANLRQNAARILTAAVQPLLIGAKEAGQLCNRSPASWWRDHASGRVPAPVKLGGKTLWRRAELERWIEAGCPSRRAWEALEKSRKATER
jgi:predicted DNA-binding transcriptional regulator AlpA